MSTKTVLIAFLLLLTTLAFSACSGMIPVTGLTPDDLAATQNAQIVNAAVATATQSALETEIAILRTQVAEVQAQPAAATAAPTAEPTATQVPPTAEPTALPTATFVPTATAVPIPCSAVEFVADITIPDGTVFSPGAYFTKTWRLRNIGACTWTGSYDLVFVDGDRMDAPYAVDLPADVYPGQVVDVTVGMVAPSTEGSYRGWWILRDPSGILFGIGRMSNPFYVDIRVVAPQAANPLDFTASYCSAEWYSGAGRVACQSDLNDSRGAVRRIDKPTLESGYIDDEPVLLTQPQMITDGVIRGKFPAVRVEQGYHFTSVIGCANKADGCDVKFQLDYQIGDGSIQTLAQWHEVYDEAFHAVDVDLSSLAGKDVKFILTVLANGSATQDRAQWLAPHISKP